MLRAAPLKLTTDHITMFASFTEQAHMLLCGVRSKHMISLHSDYIFPFCSARKRSIFPLEHFQLSLALHLSLYEQSGICWVMVTPSNGKELSKGWFLIHSDFSFLYFNLKGTSFPLAADLLQSEGSKQVRERGKVCWIILHYFD